MTGRSAIRRLLAAAATANLLAFASAASAQDPPVATGADEQGDSGDRSFTFVDLYASVGYSTNAFMNVGDSQGSTYGRLSANAVHNMVGERGSTTFSAFVESAYYFDDQRDIESVFSLNGNTDYQVSERTTVFGSVGFSRDIGGQLSSRFVVLPAVPEAPDPTAPPPVIIDDPDLFSINQRQSRLSGQAGMSTRVSERGSVQLSAGAQRVFYSGDFRDDFTTLFANGSYNYQMSEITTVGGRLNVSRTSYDNDAGKTLILNPELTLRTMISETWDASFAAGVVFSKVELDSIFDDDDSDWSTDFSLAASICRQSELERLCAQANRGAQNSAIADVATTTSASISWYRRLDADQTVALSAGVSRFDTSNAFGDDFGTTFFHVGANYDRNISRRLFAGVSVNARKLSQDGTDPDTDLSGTVYLRYRLGDLL